MEGKDAPYNRDDLKRRQKARACWHIQTNRCLSEGSDLHFAFTQRLVGVLSRELSRHLLNETKEIRYPSRIHDITLSWLVA